MNWRKLVLKVIFLTIATFAQAQEVVRKNEFCVKVGAFSMSKSLDRKVSEQASDIGLISPNLGFAYYRKLKSPWYVGINTDYLLLRREIRNFSPYRNNPDRENLPIISQYAKQSIFSLTPSVSFRPKLIKNLYGQVEIGVGMYYQFYPTYDFSFSFQNSDEWMADTEFYLFLEKGTSRIGTLVSGKVGLGYKIGNSSFLSVFLSGNRSITRLDSVSVFPVHTQIKVNDQYYSFVNRTIFSGHSFDITYTISF